VPRFYAGIGSRETPYNTLQLIPRIADKLGCMGFTLRSGGAPGADQAFEQCISEFFCEIYLPWDGFEGKHYDDLQYLRWLPEAMEIAAKYHPAWDRLSRGGKALMARNVHQVLGQDLKTPSEFVVCYTKDGKASGGTGQALRIAEDYKIDIYNIFDPNCLHKLWRSI